MFLSRFQVDNEKGKDGKSKVNNILQVGCAVIQNYMLPTLYMTDHNCSAKKLKNLYMLLVVHGRNL